MSKKPAKPDPKSPFAALKGLGDRIAVQERDRREAEEKERLARQKKAAAAREEGDLWAEAMAGVRPLEGNQNVARPKRKAAAVTAPVKTEDDEVIDELQGLVDGSIALNFEFSDEHVEGRALDCSHAELGKLKRGDLAVQARLDLHGMNREEAKAALHELFRDCALRGHRVALVIVGRGLHTPGGKPVLKELVARWLAQGGLSRFVLAFCSARAVDGGVGALYVLLRRNPRLSL